MLQVFTIARYHRHRIASAIFEVTLSAQVTITHQRNPFFLPTAVANKLRRNNAFSAVFQIIGSLAAFYLPHYGISLYESLCAAVGEQPRTYAAIKTLAFALITGSALCNGLLYGIKNKLLKKTYQNYRRKMMTKCEVNQEIQARTPSACGSRRPSLTPVAAAAGAGCGGCKIGPAAAALLRRRSSDMSLISEPVDLRRQYGGEPEDVDHGFGNHCNANPIRRSYSTNTTAGGGDGTATASERLIAANRNAFVRRILQDSRPGRSPRILITRAMSEENESYAFEPGTPVRKDLLAQKLSSSSVTLFIDDRGSRSGCGAAGTTSCLDDDDDDASLPAYSSLSSSNDESGSCCGGGQAQVSSA